MKRLREAVGLLFAAGEKFGKDRASRLAAALSFYLMISIAPLLVVVVGIISQVVSRLLTADIIVQFLERVGLTQDLLAAEELMPFLENIIGSEAVDWLNSTITEVSAPASMTLAALISLVVMFWGASNVFNHLKETINIIWGVRAAPGAGVWLFVRGRILAFAAVFGMGILLAIFLLLNTVVASLVSLSAEVVPDYLEFLPTWRAIQIVQFVVAYFVMAFLFGLIFKVLPDVQIAWNDVLVGALFTAFLFIIGTLAMAVYFQYSSTGSLYGAAGSIIVILFWFYYSAQIFLFGAEFTQVYATRYGKKILPAEHAAAYSLVRVEDPDGDRDAEDSERDEAVGTVLTAPDWFIEVAKKVESILGGEGAEDVGDDETSSGAESHAKFDEDKKELE